MTRTRQERFSVLKFQLGAPYVSKSHPRTCATITGANSNPKHKVYHDFVMLSIPLLLRFARIRSGAASGSGRRGEQSLVLAFSAEPET
jgi:hypothetical protein